MTGLKCQTCLVTLCQIFISNCFFLFVFVLYYLPANELDRNKWEEDWDKNRGAFPFSEKLGEISDKIGSTIDDTLNKFRKKERDDSPDRIR